MNMTNYTLTRLLYSEDEIIFTFITSLLKRESISESYYWAYELYYSGTDIFSLLWKIYFDFYVLFNTNQTLDLTRIILLSLSLMGLLK